MFYTPSPSNNQTGFTLIEILVALAVIAIALGALMKASGSHINSISFLKQKTLAHYVAMNEITRLQVEHEWPDIGKTHKSTEMASYEWFWTREVKKVLNPITGKPFDAIRQVTFTIFSDEDRERNLTKLIVYISQQTTKSPAPNN